MLTTVGNQGITKMDYVFASCDSAYLLEYGDSFINSVIKAGHKPRIHVVNPTTAAHTYMAEHLNCLWTAQNNAPDDRTFYSVARFLIVPTLLKENPDDRYMILDIDCVVNKKLTFPDESVGLFFRDPDSANPGNDWEREGMNIAAGIVYIGQGGLPFIKNVAAKIQASYMTVGNLWFTDQVMLYRESLEWEGNIYNFSDSYICWDFDRTDVHISTAKGALKRDKRYLELKKSYES